MKKWLYDTGVRGTTNWELSFLRKFLPRRDDENYGPEIYHSEEEARQIVIGRLRKKIKELECQIESIENGDITEDCDPYFG